MADIEDIRRRLKETDTETVMSIVELGFRSMFSGFLKDGRPRTLYQGDFFGNSYPLSLVYQNKDGETLFPYEATKVVFENIFRNDVQGNISEYPIRMDETTLTQYPDMPDALRTYVGKKVKTETISYLLKARGDNILRKIDFIRYAGLDNNSPIAVAWDAKSWDSFGLIPSTRTDLDVYAHAASNRN